MDSIGAPVGKGGINIRDDVMTVQRLLNARLGTSARLKVDGVAGPRTVAAIEAFQRGDMRLGQPDGLVEPGRRTITSLTRPALAGRLHATRSSGSVSVEDVVPGDRLSGAAWWYAHQARYPNSSSLDDLAPGFRQDARRFIAALREGGANVHVSATLRNPTRAHLMHYSWRVSRGQIAHADVPGIDGCDIIWDHGDLTRSRAAAAEMVRLFRIVFKPSLTSNHIRGTAIDMTIDRPASLAVSDGRGIKVTITSAAELHQFGATFGVHKLATDPPHWSANGR